MLRGLWRRITNKKEKEIGGQKPIFIKEFNGEPQHLKNLEYLYSKVDNPKAKQRIATDIKMLKYGLVGEKNVAFELKYCDLPIRVLHGIRVGIDGDVANIDFIVISPFRIYILETKRLVGDILVDCNGNFIREKYGSQEGMYSPITQVERQAQILYKVLSQALEIDQSLIEGVVVVANPKSVVNFDNAPYNIQGRVLKFDQINSYLKGNIDPNEEAIIDNTIIDVIVDQLIDCRIPVNYDYDGMYGLNTQALVNDPNKSLETRLKEYRLNTSRKLKIPAYQIFTDKELELLIKNQPKTESQLINIRGFGKYKVNKYGEGILKAIRGGA